VLAFEFARGMHLRNLFVVLGLFVAALMFAAAPAHAHPGHTEDVEVAHDADAPAHAHHDRAQDQSSDHDPADHSHPLGEDTYHEKASHSSLDFAHYHVVAVKLSALPRAANLPAVDEAASGLVPTPLLRPPLG
jgi:hypothetical protein